MRVAIIDLGFGNLNSVRWALERLGAEAVITGDADTVLAADAIVVPGVGHFAAASARLADTGLDTVIWRRAGAVPLLGICLGMQILFDRSEEGGRGLGLLPGAVTRLRDPAGPLPHVGWNAVQVSAAAGIMARAGAGDAYFCHTYAVRPEDALLAAAFTDYGDRFVSAVQKGVVCGVQFHPERSAAYGAAVLKAFLGLAQCSR
ncbi:MAG: imidazole glycerol phosphate synthase subunit HisH [Clostridia bacterium]